MRKIILWMSLCTLIVFSMSLSAAELPVLTLSSAISSANTYSTELSQIRRQQVLNGEKLTEAASGDSYKTYQKQYLENEYSDKEEGVQKSAVAYEISKLFDEILLNQSKLENMERSLKNDKLQLDNLKTKSEKGLISKAAFNKSVVAYETSQNNAAQLKSTMSTQYTTLCEKIGSSTVQYQLKKDAIVYEPFEIMYDNVEGHISAKAEQNLSVWKAMENAKINKEVDMEALEKAGNSYTTYLQLSDSVVQAQEASETTKQQFENTLRSKYTELLQLQEKYKLQQKELQLQENQLMTKEKQYKAGRVSKIEYETLRQSYEETKTALTEIIVKQEYIKQVIINPYLL